MSFWPPFLIGIITGSVVVWQLGQRKRPWVKQLTPVLAPAAPSFSALVDTDLPHQAPSEDTPDGNGT